MPPLRLLIPILFAGLIFQPLLSVVASACGCHAPAGHAGEMVVNQDEAHDCCTESAPDAPAQPEREQDESCPCPKTCCLGIVKVPMAAGSAGMVAMSDPVEDVGPAWSAGSRGDAWHDRLKRPPRARTAA